MEIRELGRINLSSIVSSLNPWTPTHKLPTKLDHKTSSNVEIFPRDKELVSFLPDKFCK